MFMNYTALTLPAEDPFWTARENEGAWTSAGNTTRTKFLPGAGMLIANHGLTGTSEIINAKVHDTDPSYCRLRYNTDFPWESNSRSGATAAQISLEYPCGKSGPELPDSINLAGLRDGVLYRQTVFPKDSNGGTPTFCDLADIVIPGGQISVVRFRKIRPAILTSGHYGMPHLPLAPVVGRREIEGRSSLVIAIPGRQLAVTNYQGWDTLATVDHQGQHPEAAASTLVYLSRTDGARYGAPEILIAIQLHKTDDQPWTDEELQPIRSVGPLTPGTPETLGGIRITLKSGENHEIDFRGIDGSSSR
jgi:hypothetical protein